MSYARRIMCYKTGQFHLHLTRFRGAEVLKSRKNRREFEGVQMEEMDDDESRAMRVIWPVMLSMIASLAIVGLVIALVLKVEWLREGLSSSGAIRNLMVVLVGTIALLLATLRNLANSRQLYAHTRIAARERLSRAHALLASRHLFARIVGLHIMRDLAHQAEEECLRVVETLESVLAHPPATKDKVGQADEDLDLAEEVLAEVAPRAREIEDGITPRRWTRRTTVTIEGLAAIAMLVLPFVFVVVFVSFRENPSLSDTPVMTSTNLLLACFAAMSLPIAVWAGVITQQQSVSAQQKARDDLFHTNADLLSHDMLSIRLSAIRSLAPMMQDDKENGVDAKKLLCEFVRHAPDAGIGSNRENLLGRRGDVSEAVRVLFSRSKYMNLLRAETKGIDLHGADLSGFVLRGHVGLHREVVGVSHADLSGAVLSDADLSYGWITHANLTCCILTCADMSNTVLVGSDLSGSDLSDTQLNGADVSFCKMYNVIGLTQDELDVAASAIRPPLLKGSRDAKTGEPLVWRVDVVRKTPIYLLS